MDLGFETIGNATLIAYDGGPVLATDPWLDGPAYFGSWTRTHEIPEAQRDAVSRCGSIWISHGHPDHLAPDDLAKIGAREILLADHVGGRMARELSAQGFRVRILPTGEWTQLSPRIRVLTVPDFAQDSILLIDIDGHLVIDANDVSDRGHRALMAAEVARAKKDAYLLWLTGYGDADLLNWFDEDGRFVEPPAAQKLPVGKTVADALHALGARRFIPFSSMHRYQRTDSAWANAYATPLAAHAEGFSSHYAEILPAFAHVDLAREEIHGLNPPEAPKTLFPPEAFGDDWSEPLRPGELDRIKAYFAPLEHLRRALGWIDFKVGGRSNVVKIGDRRPDLGLTFETPRASLLAAVDYRVFEDLFIGNFTKATAHGPWGRSGTSVLYPDVGPFIGKYGDNGGARSTAELRAYFGEYRRRGFMGFGLGPDAAREKAVIESYL
jgi:hypothetical protein